MQRLGRQTTVQALHRRGGSGEDKKRLETYNPAAKPTLSNGQSIAYYSNRQRRQPGERQELRCARSTRSRSSQRRGLHARSVPGAAASIRLAVSFSGKVGQVTATCTDSAGAVSVSYTSPTARRPQPARRR